MKSIINFSLFALLTLTVFSCKDKAASAADATEAAAASDGTKFTVAPESAKITWEGSKPAGKHVGTINITSGELTVKDGAVSAGSFIIDMNSIIVTDLAGDEKLSLEEHLKGTGTEGADDFFSATKFPTGKFEIISVTPSTEAGANAIVKGNLTLKDIAKEVSIPATITVTGDMVAVTSNPFSINRTDWGINYASKISLKRSEINL
ncbi:MAG: YceI family protein [Saprospiraceae bacterium]|nr:YceI family protein [Saprospiraceae bacterium]